MKISYNIVRELSERKKHVGYDKTVFRLLTLFTQFTVNMLVPIFLCSFIGYLIDSKFNSNCFFVILFFVGALAGFRNVYILAKRTYSKGKEESGRKNEDKEN